MRKPGRHSGEQQRSCNDDRHHERPGADETCQHGRAGAAAMRHGKAEDER